MSDITETLAPKSDQLDGVDLASGPRVFTVTSVDVRPNAEQPVVVHLAEFPRPWKPGKNMRRVLGFCWGNDSANWPGRRVKLYFDPDVKFGNDKPGGTRISHLSHIDGPQSVPILITKGKPGAYKVDPLPDAPATPTEDPRIVALRAKWKQADADGRAEIEQQIAAIKEGLA